MMKNAMAELSTRRETAIYFYLLMSNNEKLQSRKMLPHAHYYNCSGSIPNATLES